MNSFSEIMPEYQNKIIESVRWLHQHPELSMQEYMTSEYIRNALTAYGIEVLDYPIDTGVLAIVRGAKEGATIAMRGDIDALPVTENPDNPVISLTDGMMHACGHDIHTAALLGAAMMLHDHRNTLCGQVLLIFQPAEERSKGALAVIGSGVFDQFKPSAIFSMHVMPDVMEGQVSVQSGPIMAAQEGFTIEIHGKGSHGASPHLSHDPVIAGVDIVNALQKITSRMVDPLNPFVLSVCSFHGGSAFNIIPETCTIMGSCRYLDNQLRDFIKESIKNTAENTAAIYGCSAEVSFYMSLRATDNHPSLLPVATRSAEKVFGNENVMKAAVKMSSEDFSMFSQVAPIFMYHVGCGKDENSPPLHNACFHVNDEVLLNSAVLLAETASAATSEL